MASPDGSGTHHFIAADGAALRAIYEHIVDMATHLEPAQEARGDLIHPAGAVVSITGQNYNATTLTDANGNFAFSGVPAGSYTLSASATSGDVNFTVLTNTPCGTAITPKVTVVAGQTATKDLFLAEQNPATTVKSQLFVTYQTGYPASSRASAGRSTSRPWCRTSSTSRWPAPAPNW